MEKPVKNKLITVPMLMRSRAVRQTTASKTRLTVISARPLGDAQGLMHPVHHGADGTGAQRRLVNQRGAQGHHKEPRADQKRIFTHLAELCFEPHTPSLKKSSILLNPKAKSVCYNFLIQSAITSSENLYSIFVSRGESLIYYIK